MDKHKARRTLLDEAVKLAPFEGWNEPMAVNAYVDAGLSESEYIRVCPDGFINIIETWFETADAAMTEFANTQDIPALKIRERIKLLILFRLDYFGRNKEAFKKACHTLTMPWNAAINLRLLHHSVDRIWEIAGDNSNDYNWYSKRFLLSGVYSSTLMCWFGDESVHYRDTKAFLDRRIENVMSVGNFIGKVLKKQKAA